MNTPSLTQLASSTVFSELLENRPMCLSISAALGTHVSLVALGLPSWQCPIRYGLGVPCPGCGLSRAVVALMHGDWHQALLLHAFAPIVAIALILIFVCGLLPNSVRQGITTGMRYLERHLGVSFLFLIGLLGYWAVRLLFFNKILYELVM
ncbi:MAG: DUF2752 domain-containing protein [Cyanobacteria bacterium J06626_18]